MKSRWILIPTGNQGGHLIEHLFNVHRGLYSSLCSQVETHGSIIEYGEGPDGNDRCVKMHDTSGGRMIWATMLGFITDITSKIRARLLSKNGDIVPVSDWARETLRIAETQIGLGEEGGNNRGKHIKKWGRGRENISWCAAFLAWCMEEAAKNLGYRVPLFEHKKWPRWRVSAKALVRELGKLGVWVDLPLLGDLSLFERGLDDDWKGHMEIVKSITLGNTKFFQDIGGNVGKYPARVREIQRHPDKNRFIGHVRLPELSSVGIKLEQQ